MSIWDSYESRMTAYGSTKREALLKRELHLLESKLKDSLSYHSVVIDGDPHDVAIVNSDNIDEKVIYSTAKNVIQGGELVVWMDNYWLVVECDANSEVYTKAKLQQCNYLLKWIDTNAIIHEQWCIIKDGTKYLTGEYEDRQFIVTRGDSRIAMTIAKNEYTVNFGRENRFLIDDPDSSSKLAYALTKPLKVGSVYNNYGVYNFVLQETVSTDNDNYELGIADYYKHFPKNNDTGNSGNKDTPGERIGDNGKKVWL